MEIYRIADLNIGVENQCDFSKKYMKDYLVDGTDTDFVVSVTESMIDYEKQIAIEKVPEQYYELTGILRCICEKILEEYNGFFLHCSCLLYEDKAIVFTAKSGTGKSTHGASADRACFFAVIAVAPERGKAFRRTGAEKLEFHSGDSFLGA